MRELRGAAPPVFEKTGMLFCSLFFQQTPIPTVSLKIKPSYIVDLRLRGDRRVRSDENEAGDSCGYPGCGSRENPLRSAVDGSAKMGHRRDVNFPFSRKQLEWVQLGAAALIVFVSALLAADPVRTGLGLWFGALWLLLAWRYGISPLLMSLLVFCALRSEVSGGVPSSWFLSVNLGLSAYTLTAFFRTAWSAGVSAVLWVSVMAASPLLLVLVLAGFPRFRKMHSDHVRWFFVPAMLLFLGLGGKLAFRGALSPLLERPFDLETYQALGAFFLKLFSVESLWRVLPLIGLFELTQKLPDDHRFTWKNLMVAAALVCWLLVPLAPAVQMTYLVGFPVLSILLSRWCLALPDLISRSIFCVGMFWLALPFLQGGLG